MSPTARQMDALRFIRGYQLAHGKSPGFREIAEGMGLNNVAVAFGLLARLKERGLVRQPYRKRRRANRNRPIEVLTEIAVPRDPNGEPLYFVRVP